MKDFYCIINIKKDVGGEVLVRREEDVGNCRLQISMIFFRNLENCVFLLFDSNHQINHMSNTTIVISLFAPFFILKKIKITIF